jgi:hypothetical protein
MAAALEPIRLKALTQVCRELPLRLYRVKEGGNYFGEVPVWRSG